MLDSHEFRRWIGVGNGSMFWACRIAGQGKGFEDSWVGLNHVALARSWAK